MSKLKVGQRIGIYEILPEYFGKILNVGDSVIGNIPVRETEIIKTCMNKELLFEKEVRKVGTLIVKKVK